MGSSTTATGFADVDDVDDAAAPARAEKALAAWRA